VADRQHKHRDLWVALAVGLIFGGAATAIAIWAAELPQPHVGLWPHAGEIAGLALIVLGVFLAVAVVRGWWLPGGFTIEQSTSVSSAPSAATAIETAQADAWVLHQQKLDSLLLEGRLLHARIAGGISEQEDLEAALPRALRRAVAEWEADVTAALARKRGSWLAHYGPVPLRDPLKVTAGAALRRIDIQMSVLEAAIRA
jgi:hypothetical protein